MRIRQSANCLLGLQTINRMLAVKAQRATKQENRSHIASARPTFLFLAGITISIAPFLELPKRCRVTAVGGKTMSNKAKENLGSQTGVAGGQDYEIRYEAKKIG